MEFLVFMVESVLIVWFKGKCFWILNDKLIPEKLDWEEMNKTFRYYFKDSLQNIILSKPLKLYFTVNQISERKLYESFENL